MKIFILFSRNESSDQSTQKSCQKQIRLKAQFEFILSPFCNENRHFLNANAVLNEGEQFNIDKLKMRQLRQMAALKKINIFGQTSYTNFKKMKTLPARKKKLKKRRQNYINKFEIETLLK